MDASPLIYSGGVKSKSSVAALTSSGSGKKERNDPHRYRCPFRATKVRGTIETDLQTRKRSLLGVREREQGSQVGKDYLLAPTKTS